LYEALYDGADAQRDAYDLRTTPRQRYRQRMLAEAFAISQTDDTSSTSFQLSDIEVFRPIF